MRPDGTTICNNTGAQEDTCSLGPTGNYKLIVRDNSGPNTGNYNIAVRRLDVATGCTALTFGAAPTTASIAAAGEMDCFSFTGASLDDIRLRIIENAPGDPVDPRTEFIRPNGTSICGPSNNLERTCILDAAGSHKLLVTDNGGTNTGSYRIQIQRLNNPGGTCPFLTSGAAPTGGNIATSPEMDCFKFATSTANQVLRWKVAETSGSLFATL